MAEKFRRKKQSELALGLCEDRKRTKWADFRRQYREVLEAGKSPKTITCYEASLDAYQRLLKPRYVDAIRTVDIDRFIAKRQKDRQRARGDNDGEASLSPCSVNMDLRALKAAFRKAHEWGMLASVPKFEMLREPEKEPEFVDDESFAKLYKACDTMTRPAKQHFDACDWWRAIITFAYLTGWRIGEILSIRRKDVDFRARTVFVSAEQTKGKRDARIELHPVVVDHLKAIIGFDPMVFARPHHERTLWADFERLKQSADVEFSGAFHRFRFGFANANVGRIEEDVLQQLMRHQDRATTRHYVNKVERLRNAETADKVHIPDLLKAQVS